MPELVQRDVTPNQIKEGDGFQWKGKGYVASGVETKQKWVYVGVGEDSPRLRVSIDETITVSRMEATPEETAAKRLEFQESLIRSGMDGIDEDVEEAKQRLIDNLVYRPSFHDDDYENYVRAQTRQEIWIGVRKWFEKEPDKGLIGIVCDVIAELSDELLRSQFANGSSHGMTNAVENVIRQAKADWVRDMRNYVR